MTFTPQKVCDVAGEQQQNKIGEDYHDFDMEKSLTLNEKNVNSHFGKADLGIYHNISRADSIHPCNVDSSHEWFQAVTYPVYRFQDFKMLRLKRRIKTFQKGIGMMLL